MGRTCDWIRASSLNALIAANVGVWLALRITAVVLWSVGDLPDAETAVCRWVELPSAWSELKLHFYGAFTYMFAQYSVLHLIFNMLWLYCFGRIFLEFHKDRLLSGLYLTGGLTGAVFFIAGCHLFPASGTESGAWLIGSSAAILAIVAATAIIAPGYPVRLFLLGTVSLKWIALATIVLLMIPGSALAGSTAAHLGGAAAGAFYGWGRKTGWLRLNRRRRRSVVNLATSDSTPDERKELDRLLDKIRTSGYASLTKAEQRRLIEVSRKIE